MKKKYGWALVGLLSLAANSAWANFKIQVEFETEELQPKTTWVEAEEGKAQAFTMDQYRIRLTPVSMKSGMVEIQAEIREIKGRLSQLKWKPVVITRVRQTAEISDRSDDGTLQYRLKLTPTKVKRKN